MQTDYKKNLLAMVLAGLTLLMMNIGAFASSHQDAPLITLDPAANTTDVYAFLTQGTNLATYVVVSNILVTNIVNGHHVISTGQKHYYVTNFQQYLTVALSVYPFEEPGSGPNPYRFDDNVVYVFYVATNQNHVLTGRSDLSYQFQFHTTFQNNQTIFQSFTGVVTNVGDVNQNMVQTYTVTKVVLSTGAATVLGSGIVPPNNEGISTPFYNQGNNGNNPAQSGAVT